MYYRSIGALQQILLYRPDRNDNDDSKVTSTEKSSTFCSISNAPNNILYMGNGEEYYHLELVCKDETEYGIQAYGEEAKALYREVRESGRTNHVAEQQSRLQSDLDIKEDQEKCNLLKRELDYITSFSFDDKNGYYLVFKKLKNVCISRKKKMKPDLP
ncbi:MAG: hypothetical protein JO327_05235 [Nitrososphaeraceae archaeon]|nr:hypothetical protein [Nitrososphaeraceae archaeon]